MILKNYRFLTRDCNIISFKYLAHSLTSFLIEIQPCFDKVLKILCRHDRSKRFSTESQELYKIRKSVIFGIIHKNFRYKCIVTIERHR